MIVKPDCFSQGKGIFLATEVDKIPLTEPSVVQEYLNDPYLLDGLKFDLRVYVLVTSADPLRIYIHKEGLVRFATENYEKIELTNDGKLNMQNVFVHLTNYALNKESDAFRQAQDVTD